MRLTAVLAVLLAAFLVFGAAVERWMAAEAGRMAAILAQAENRAGQARLDEARAQLHRFKTLWKRVQLPWSLITDHQEMDLVEMAMDQADRYLSAGNPGEARAELATLRFLIRHIPEKETLGLKSIL